MISSFMNLQELLLQHHQPKGKPKHQENHHIDIMQIAYKCVVMINQVVIFRHIKAQVKEEYMDAKDLTKMDDNKLLMQYFRKHDTDKNHKLDGLELLKAIAGMEGRYEYIFPSFSLNFYSS